jgi:hypothetical protein
MRSVILLMAGFVIVPIAKSQGIYTKPINGICDQYGDQWLECVHREKVRVMIEPIRADKVGKARTGGMGEEPLPFGMTVGGRKYQVSSP